MGSLSLLSAYDSSSNSGSDQEEENDKESCVKISSAKTNNIDQKKSKSNILPLPDSVSKMFQEKQNHIDLTKQHQGRKRSFPHEKNNWATYVFAKCPCEIENNLRLRILQSLKFLKLGWKICDDFHISLSRTVSIPFHCIDPLFNELKKVLSGIKRISVEIFPVIKVYKNDENTRTFLSFSVNYVCHKTFLNISERIDKVFEEFGLQKYYENPSFHMSLVWTCENLINDKSTSIPMFSVNNNSNSILLVGEGNFSFSAALLRKNKFLNPSKFCATCYESFQECIQKYGKKETLDNIKYLEERGASVLHGVDATKLGNDLISGKLDLIIFQFPHTGRKASIKKNRDLLRNFFICAQSHLNSSGSIIVTLCAGQGGTPIDSIRRDYCNTWKIVEMAANANLILTEVKQFDADSFEGYLPTGRRNAGNQFNTAKSMSHRFIYAENPPSLSKDWASINTTLPSALENRLQIMDEEPDTLPQYAFAMGIVEELQKVTNIWEIKPMYREYEIYEKEFCTDKPDIMTKWVLSLIDRSKSNNTACVSHGPNFTNVKMADIHNSSLIKYDMLITIDHCGKIIEMLNTIFNSYSKNEFTVSLEPSNDANKSLSDILSSHKIIEQNVLYISHNIDRQVIGQYCQVILDREADTQNGCISIMLIEIDLVMPILNPSFTSTGLWSLDEVKRTSIKHAFYQNEAYIHRSLFPPIYVHDISFWIDTDQREQNKPPFNINHLKSIVLLTADQPLLSVEQLGKYKSCGRESLCIRATYQSRDFCLSKQMCLKLNENVRTTIAQFFNITLR